MTFIHNDKILEVHLDGQRYRQEVRDGDGLFHFNGDILIGGGENLDELQGKLPISQEKFIKQSLRNG